MSLPTPHPTPSPSFHLDVNPAVSWTDPAREAAFNAWLTPIAAQHQLQLHTLRPASADASFRRYLRLDALVSPGTPARCCIVMDAPPDKEDCQPFVKVAALMAAAGLRVPDILAWDEANGFILLSDLGAQTMMAVIQDKTPPEYLVHPEDRFWHRPAPSADVQAMYFQALDILIDWQRASRPGVLPAYDSTLLHRELKLFPDWYLGQHRGIDVDAPQHSKIKQTLTDTFDLLVKANLAGPQVYVHRDFMPRNLMASVDAAPTLGVLDFQDAVYGPVTYDIACLLRDAFLSWDESFVLDITIRYWEKARKAGLLDFEGWSENFGEFYRAVEWMGLQRHLKVAGIFARLTLRDGKPQYLADAPRFIGYIRATAGRYRELKPLLYLIDEVEGIKADSGFAFGRV
jgi:aminoglycoside/choline kinase family phosphotransferase